MNAETLDGIIQYNEQYLRKKLRIKNYKKTRLENIYMSFTRRVSKCILSQKNHVKKTRRVYKTIAYFPTHGKSVWECSNILPRNMSHITKCIIYIPSKVISTFRQNYGMASSTTSCSINLPLCHKKTYYLSFNIFNSSNKLGSSKKYDKIVIRYSLAKQALDNPQPLKAVSWTLDENNEFKLLDLSTGTVLNGQWNGVLRFKK